MSSFTLLSMLVGIPLLVGGVIVLIALFLSLRKSRRSLWILIPSALACVVLVVGLLFHNQEVPDTNQTPPTSNTEPTPVEEQTPSDVPPVNAPPSEDSPSTALPYTVHISRADYPIFDGPSYDSEYVTTVRATGVYTIVEDQTDREGNRWGKLKSGLGWVDLTQLQSEADVPVPITIEYLKNAPDLEYNLLMGDADTPVSTLLITACEDLTAVSFSELSYETGTLAPNHDLFSRSAFSQGDTFVAGVLFYGDMTTYGISFTDAAGTEHHYALSISGRNGALIAESYNPT